MGGLVLDIYIAFAIRWIILLRRKRQSRKWPVMTGTVRASSYERSGLGSAYAGIRYEYEIFGERYEGILKKPFIDSTLGQKYVRWWSEVTEVQIRVNPENRSHSILVNF